MASSVILLWDRVTNLAPSNVRRNSINNAKRKLARLHVRSNDARYLPPRPWAIKAAERKLEAAKATYKRGGVPAEKEAKEPQGLNWRNETKIHVQGGFGDGRDADRIEKAVAKRERKAALQIAREVNVHGGQLLARDAIRG